MNAQIDILTKGRTISYRGRRCNVLVYQPAKTVLKDYWPKGLPYEGLSHAGGATIE